METRDRHRLERHARRIEELRLRRNAREHPIRDWIFAIGDGKPQGLHLGDFWPEIGTPVWLTAEATVPEAWVGLPVELELWLGGEGFVRLSNGTSGGINPFHRSFRVVAKARGEVVRIEAEVVSKGLFGSHVAEPRLTHAALVVPETDVRALERDLSMILEACEQLDGHEAVPHLLDALDAASAALAGDWPTGTEDVLSRYLRGYENPLGGGYMSLPRSAADKALDVNRLGRELWSLPEAPRPIEPLPDGALRAVGEARRVVAGRLAAVKDEYPPVGRLALTGHAHLDLAWLWPLSETRRKARRTFASVLSLMERYEDFVFNQSSAQAYRWIEEDAPELFEEIKKRVAEGRWEPIGGSWTEPDCQITSGESFARQLLHGQRYFEEKLGRRASVAWLPDAFGFSPGIPQLLRGAGLTGFFTAKLKWSETNEFPHDLFLWEGLDGSRVTAHTMRNPGMDYNGDVVPFDLLGVWRAYRGKRRHPEGIFTFGWGDGGGGPSEKMLENYDRLKDFPALPRLRMSRVDELFASFPSEGLPLWSGELYLELHRGTLTTQGKVKKLNREAEHRLLEAEAFSTIVALHGDEYPAAELDRLWESLLLNQFHDILPGSSIREVYEEAHRQLEEVVKGAEGLRNGALRRAGDAADLPGDPETVIVANSSLAPRPLSVLLPEGTVGVASVADAGGERLPVQKLAAGQGFLVHAPGREVPALGWTTLTVRRGEVAPEAPAGGSRARSGEIRGGSGGGVYLENELLRVEVGADGTLHRVYDKEFGREVLQGRGNQLWAYADKPREWDAWDVDEDYELEGEEVSGHAGAFGETEEGLRAAVEYERDWRGSRIRQSYRLHAGSRRLDVATSIEWHEREVFLRALFPLNVRASRATFETMYGAQERPTHRNTSWDAARFEVSAHRFADLSEPGYGVALLNDGKYGHSAKGNVLGLSLLRGPMYPDPLADEGLHHFTYSLLPHRGDWTEAGVVREAFALNSPLSAVVARSGALPPEYGFVTSEGLEVALGALKMAGDGRGAVLRLYEPHGARGVCTLRFALPVESVKRTNLLEEPEEALEVEDGSLVLRLRPFEVLTLRVSFREG